MKNIPEEEAKNNLSLIPMPCPPGAWKLNKAPRRNVNSQRGKCGRTSAVERSIEGPIRELILQAELRRLSLDGQLRIVLPPELLRAVQKRFAPQLHLEGLTLLNNTFFLASF